MLAKLDNRTKRIKELGALGAKLEKITSRYFAMKYWIERERTRYLSCEAFESFAIRHCEWKLRVHTTGDEATLEGRVNDLILRYFPGDWHSSLEWKDLRLGLADNDLYLSGPVDSLREYIVWNKIEVDLDTLNDTIDKRGVELTRLIRLRDTFKG